MDEIDGIISWYRRGVSFTCGCRADSLHDAVIHALRDGNLPIEALQRCPLRNHYTGGPPGFEPVTLAASDVASGGHRAATGR